MNAAWASLPIVSSLVMLAILRWPAARAMPLCAALSVAVSFGIWQVPALTIGAAFIEAGFITLSILLILFGAVWLMEQLTLTGALETLRAWLSGRTQDQLLQALLIGWGVGSFFEGAAGFGAPAVVTAQLLVALGFAPLPAVVTALVGDSVAVSFGAVGTPFLVGMAEGLTTNSPTPRAIAEQLVVYDCIVGPLVPALLIWTLGVGFGGAGSWRNCLKATPFALVFGAAHLSVAAGSVFAFGLELPSLLGPLFALTLGLFLLKTGLLVPAVPFRFPSSTESKPQVPSADASSPSDAPDPSGKQVLHAVAPYGLLVVVLVLTRLPVLGLRQHLIGASLEYGDIFGTGISAHLQPLYSPFAAFALLTALTPFWFRTPSRQLWQSGGLAVQRVSKALLPLGASVATVRVFVHSGAGNAELPAMPVVLAHWLSGAVGEVWPWFAPWLGALGSFISGSATFSNLLFAGVQHTVATEQSWPKAAVLALQAMGGAAGNMTCVHNVVAAATVVGLSGQESAVIRRTALPMAVYLLLAGALVWLLV